MDRRREVEELTVGFLTAMNLALSPSIREEGATVHVELAGPDAYLLLERKGSGLEALQLLLGRMAEQALGQGARVVIDCEGFRLGRERELADIAHRGAEQVRKTRRPLELAPMNSYERRLVHMALAEEEGVTSESLGDGFIKRIVISPA
jgi:spoIIIJ-associated protein